MGYGLAAAGGLEAAQQGLRQRLMDQMLLEKQKQDMAIQLREQALREQEASQRADLLKQGQADRLSNQQGIAQDRQDNETMRAFTMNPAGAPLMPKIAGRMRDLGLPVQETPGVAGPPAVEGLSSLATPMQGRMITPESTPESFQRGSTQADIATKTQQDAQRQAAVDMAAQRTTDQTAAEAQRQSDRQDNLKLAASLRPAPAGNEKLTRVEHKDPDTGRTVIEYLPQSAIKGQKFEKGVLGATESRLASAEAVRQTGDDMITNLSTPDLRAKLGPAMGRFNTLKDFIGNPPPEFSELAGQIESYALANMGVHGMRSAQGSRMIAQLLDQHHTPESLIASIKGLNSFATHFMENEGRKVTGSNAAPVSGGNDALPAVGGTFNGGKVLKVEKVK